MNWGAIGSLFGGFFAAIGERLFGPKASPEPPAPAPEEPGMGEIDAKIDKLLAKIAAEERAENAQTEAAERLKVAAEGRREAERIASGHPVVLPPRTPVPSDAGERAADVEAMDHMSDCDLLSTEADPPTVPRKDP